MKPTPPTFSHLTSRSGRITQMRLGIGGRRQTADYRYDGVGRLVQADVKLSDGRNFSEEFEYDLTTYDAAGRKHALIQGYRDSKGAVTSADTTLYIGNFLVVNGKVDRVTTPYGYLRGGKFHTFIRDYQGSVVCVATADGVVQATTYYPDGLPQSNSTGIHNNKQKHLAKELDFFQGANYYDYTARYAVPARGLTFNSIDRRVEDFRHLSPYSSNAGDPINNIDPTGEKFENPDEAKEMKEKVEERINEYKRDINQMSKSTLSSARLAISNCRRNINKLRQWLKGYKRLEKSETMYGFKNTNEEIGSIFVETNNDGNETVYLSYNGTTQQFVHEFAHLIQYDKGKFANAERETIGNRTSFIVNDLSFEVEAYRFQFAYDNLSVIGAKSMSDITKESVSEMRAPKSSELLYRSMRPNVKYKSIIVSFLNESFLKMWNK